MQTRTGEGEASRSAVASAATDQWATRSCPGRTIDRSDRGGQTGGMCVDPDRDTSGPIPVCRMTRIDPVERSIGVLVLVSNPDDRRDVETWLEDSDAFDRVEVESTLAETDFDVCVLDDRARRTYGDALGEVAATKAPVAVPTLLIAAESEDDGVEGDGYERGLPEGTIDEVMERPIQHSGLGWRLGALAERSTQSRQAAVHSERYRTLFDGVQDPIVVTDPEWRIVTANGAFCEQFGYDCGEIDGESARIICAEDSDFETFDSISESNGFDEQFETTINYRTKAGKRLIGETDVLPLGNGERHGFMGLIRNLTEHHRQGRQLDRYEYAVEGAPEMLVGVDRDRTVRFANERFREFLGRTKAEIEGATLESILDAATLATVEHKIERALKGETAEEEVIETDVLGRKHVLDVRYYPLEREDGSIIGAAAAIRDVTERERQKERLIRFRRAVEAAGHAISITDVEGTIEYVNPAFEAMTGYSAREACGKTPRILRSGEMIDGYYEQLWETVLAGEVWQERVVNRRQSGELYHAEQTIAPIRTADGAVEAFVAIQTDVTDRVETNADLETYESIVQRLDDPIVLQNLEGRYVVVNDAVTEFGGLDREKLLGSDEFAFMDERTAAIIDRKKQRVLAEQRPITYEVQPRLPDGTAPTFKTTRYPHYDGDGDLVGTIAICRDTTDVQERERQLRVLDRLLRHNLRNKMTVIFGQADRIVEEFSGEPRDAAERILEAGADIVALSETEREMIDLFENCQARRPIAIRPILERLRADLVASDTEASISIECPSGVKAETIPQIERALQEVLENAIEHAERRPPDVTVTVTREDTGVRIAVADNGPGMPAAEREVLTGAAKITPLVHGRGLGLWLVHHVVTQSGSSLDFHENDPHGSVVEIRLPDVTAPEANR